MCKNCSFTLPFGASLQWAIIEHGMKSEWAHRPVSGTHFDAALMFWSEALWTKILNLAQPRAFKWSWRTKEMLFWICLTTSIALSWYITGDIFKHLGLCCFQLRRCYLVFLVTVHLQSHLQMLCVRMIHVALVCRLCTKYTGSLMWCGSELSTRIFSLKNELK